MTATARPSRMRRLLPHVQAGLCVGVLGVLARQRRRHADGERRSSICLRFARTPALLTAFGLLLGICFGCS